MSTQLKVGILIVDDDRVLLIKEKDNPESPMRWNFIKGTYDEELDKTITGAAIRECREEACVEVELTDALGCYFSNIDGKTRAQFNFLAKITDGTPSVPPADEQRRHDEDISEVRWFSAEELRSMPPEEFISQKTYVALMDHLRGIRYPLGIFREL